MNNIPETDDSIIIGYSNVSKLLSMQVCVADKVNGKIEATFEATHSFENSIGNIQGGILTAMLDDLMGYALGITLPTNRFAPTANLNVSFIRPAAVGLLHGKGEVLKSEGDLYYLAAKLYNAQGQLLAAATSKAKAGVINRA